jgi:RHS repeat-associated protein
VARSPDQPSGDSNVPSRLMSDYQIVINYSDTKICSSDGCRTMVRWGHRPRKKNDYVTINAGHTVTIASGTIANAANLSLKSSAKLQNYGKLNLGGLNGKITNNLQTYTEKGYFGCVQVLDYKYHIRGGLRGINLDVNNNLTNNLFSYRLDYEEGTTGLFDGNIKKQSWKSSIDGKQRSFDFLYDGASRLKSASYASTQSGEDYALNNVNYDFNGNITNLSRNGLKSNSTFGLIDNLNYTYNANSNKILKVDDASNETASFKDVTGNDYDYWTDGSLRKDGNKDITQIDYNYLKLPQKINLTNGRWIEYEYDASGKKLKKTLSTGKIIDYEEDEIYEDGILSQTSHDEGRIVNGEYEYNITDHLGNVRISFKDNLGIPQVTQVNHVGAWGESLESLNVINTPKTNNFTYSTYEKENDFGINVFDAHARVYDAVVPRMWQIDPLSELSRRFSPTVYGNDNPVLMIDPDGMRAVWNGKYGSETGYNDDVTGESRSWDDVQSEYGMGDYSQEETPSVVSRTLYNNMLKDWNDKNLNCSNDYACYPATWKRLEKAYSDTDGSTPDIFKTSWSKRYKGSNRTYPDLKTIFGILFGSDNQSPLWSTIPIEHRGKGAAGALVYAGLGRYANVIAGESQRSSVVQLWDSQKTYEMVRDGVDISNVPNAIGHAIIFMWYLPDKSGFKFIDQHGTGTAYFQGNSVFFGANLLDSKK